MNSTISIYKLCKVKILSLVFSKLIGLAWVTIVGTYLEFLLLSIEIRNT